MIHYTCDRCKRAIDSICETRFHVQIDIQPAVESDLQNTSLEEVDQLASLHEQLQREVEQMDLDQQVEEESDALFASCKDATQDFAGNFDLCPQCYQAFCKNPLGGESTIGLGFSNN